MFTSEIAAVGVTLFAPSGKFAENVSVLGPWKLNSVETRT